MEDYKYLIYLALSIIYFIFKGIGKKNKKAQPKENEKTSAAPSKSFEQILAELTGTANEEEELVVPPRQTTASISPDRGEEKDRPYYDAADYANADDTLKELYKKGEKLKTINEMVEIKPIETSGHFKAYSIEEDEDNLAEEIREDFSNPRSVKKAFIYSEIFNRKY
jgi:hypothetical protein